MSESTDADNANAPANGIAIIGMAGRFPGAENTREFWRNLCAGVESVSRFEEAELEDSFGPEIRRAANFVKARPILQHVEMFDAPFFGMYAREAELTDPQQRLFLEIAWECLEDAGYDPASYRGAIGVFAGASPNTYFLHNVCGDRGTIEQFTSNYQVGCYPLLLGLGHDFVSTRVSYKLDLKGPSLTVQSACSTSLLAVAKACQSLLLYESDMAIAGGVSVTFPQKRGYQHLEGGMVSADGTCRPFDAEASGTIFGSGAGAVILKRLEEAVADGDHIYAVIRGSAVNNDGASKVGFTAPSVEGQASAIETAIAAAGVEARSISYVECHGTATPLGDPIEIAGLTQAFAASTRDVQFCAVGSVKGNIGHLDAAAGVAGLIKTALALEAAVLPPSLHYRQANPQIDFAKTPFFVNSALRPWAPESGPRRAGVSAFGVGGTNVHVVLEEPPAAAQGTAQADTSPQLLILSARSAAALDAARKNLASHLRTQSTAALADVAFSLQVGRRAFDHRLSLLASDRADALKKLEGGQRDIHSAMRAPGGDVVFMFPGQGAQYPDMGRGLFESEAVFRAHIERCAAIASPLMGSDLLELLYPEVNSSEAKQRLMSTVAAQPAIFSIEYALAQLWMSWGVRPSAMIGHSVGEFVAAVIAGVFSLEDALGLVVARGRLMQELPGGAMLAVRLPEAELVKLLHPSLNVAAINAPALCVVSGPYQAVDEFEKVLATRNVVSRRLHTSHAFHSSMVEPVVEPLRRQLQGLSMSAPTIPYVSCVSGDWVQTDQATSPDYWARHAREPVRFADGIAKLCASGTPILIEVGPGSALSTLALQTLRGRDIAVISSMQDASRELNDRDCMLEALGGAWCRGVAPDWRALHGTRRVRVPLPTYPFERSRHWIEAPKGLSTSLPQPTQAVPMAVGPPPLPQNEIAMPRSTAENPLAEISAAIAAIFEELSGETPGASDAQTTFLEMGYDSLFLTQVAQKIQSQMKVKITFRQLLGDYATIPSLAAFLVDKVPKSSMPASAAALATAVAQPAPNMPAMPGQQNASTVPSAAGVEGIFRDQLQAMAQLIQRQFEVLQGLQPGSDSASVARAPSAPPAASPPDTTGSEAAQPSRFAIFTGERKASDHGISAEQRKHIETLVARYNAKTPGSKKFAQTYRPALADPRAAAGFRSEWKEMVYPIVAASCGGSKIRDVDGNEYVDLVNGFGQTALGHSPDFVVEAVKRQLDLGFAIGPQAELAGKVAALFCEMTGNERMTFCNTGSEAVMAAMRIARTVTGREKIVVFNGDYHGQFDEVLVKGVQRGAHAPRSMPVAPGIPASQVANMIVLEYGAQQSLDWIRANAETLAAVVVEPVQSRHPNLRPFDFLREVRRITESSGTAFVMDEVVTGFRVHPGGMQALTGIRADLVTYGKIIGGGLPIGVLAGKSTFMDALDGGQWNFGDASFPEVGVTFFAGTFVRHPLVLASAWAVLKHLKAHGPALQETLTSRTEKLVRRLNGLFLDRGISTQIESYASWFYFHFHNEHPLATLLYYHLRERGIHIQDGFPCFLTTAHSDADYDQIYDAFESSVDEMQSVGILGRSPASASIALTESQLEIWLSAQLGDEASCAFNESVSLRMQGTLNAAALRAALDFIVARHDALRTRFSSTGEEMRISPTASMQVAESDFSQRPPVAAEQDLAALIDGDARSAFDLVNGAPIRANLVKLSSDSHVLILTAHHIVCDGWSINVIVNELAQIYSSLSRGEAPQLPPALPFSSYARTLAQRDAAQGTQTEEYWLKQFAERPQSLELPTDRPRPAIKSFSGASHCQRIGAKLHQAVKKAGARQGSTLFVTLLAAFQALMGRLANQNEVVVGVPTAGQSLLDDQILVGHCVNFLPIRGAWTRQTRVSEYLSAVGKQVLDAYEHQEYTFGTLVRKLALPREAGRLPLAEIQFNLERLSDKIELPGLSIEVTPNAKAHVNFDLFLNVIESADGLRLDCDYNTDLFDASTVAHWLDCYQALLEAIAADANQPLSTVSCMPAAERERLLITLNATAAQFPREACVHQLIETQAQSTPAAIAAQFRTETVTYEGLDQRANQLAQLLKDRLKGAAPGDRLVGVCLERSLEMLVALIAVLKAGCAYVPLDPTHPPSRLRHILNDAKVAALISDGSIGASAVGKGVALIDVRSDAAAIAAADLSAPEAKVSPEDLAYVIYTSGSTGLPKGVEISHRSVVNLLSSMAKEPGLSARDVFCAVTTLSFDIAGLELFLPLTVGAKLVIIERDDILDGFKLVSRLKEVGASAMQATPAGWRLALEAGFRAPAGFKMLCGGEALPRELANALLEGSGGLWNLYGPTETTIWSSCVRVSAGAAVVTVGAPIDNTQFYVLDRNDEPLPTGVPGQLHIGGEGVARGYHQRPELTQDKFLANPFAPGRMYRTGDLARWLSDGSLQVLGRIDHQVKLRGFRIEPGEIEAVLMRKIPLTAVAVILREDVPGTPRLVAYYAERAGANLKPEELRAGLADDLPDYMMPSAWVRLDRLPLSPNGKLDRAALPVPESGHSAEEVYAAPTSATELALTKIFGEVLRMERVGVNADLLKLGADSIQLFQITARANRSGIKITAKQVLQHRSAAALARLVDPGAAANTELSVEGPSSGATPLPTLGQFKRTLRAGSTSKR